jgi:hypothetical protein
VWPQGISSPLCIHRDEPRGVTLEIPNLVETRAIFAAESVFGWVSAVAARLGGRSRHYRMVQFCKRPSCGGKSSQNLFASHLVPTRTAADRREPSCVVQRGDRAANAGFVVTRVHKSATHTAPEPIARDHIMNVKGRRNRWGAR